MNPFEELAHDYQTDMELTVDKIRLSDYGLALNIGCDKDHLLMMINRAKNSSNGKAEEFIQMVTNFKLIMGTKDQ